MVQISEPKDSFEWLAIWEDTRVKDQNIKTYKLTKRGLDVVENAINKSTFDALSRGVASLREVLGPILIEQMKKLIFERMEKGKRYFPRQIRNRIPSEVKYLQWEFHLALLKLKEEGKITEKGNRLQLN